MADPRKKDLEVHDDSHSRFLESTYRKVPVDDLVVYAVKAILEAGEECTFERLVFECYSLFPKQFALQRYPQWPDSARVNKGWLRCRTDKGWISGSVKEGFRLTPKGEDVARKVTQKLSGLGARPMRRSGRARERFEAVLRNIREDGVFKRFIGDPSMFKVTEMELRSVLCSTLETPVTVLRQNVQYFLYIAEQYKDEEAKRFLEVCKEEVDKLAHRGK